MPTTFKSLKMFQRILCVALLVSLLLLLNFSFGSSKAHALSGPSHKLPALPATATPCLGVSLYITDVEVPIPLPKGYGWELNYQMTITNNCGYPLNANATWAWVLNGQCPDGSVQGAGSNNGHFGPLSNHASAQVANFTQIDSCDTYDNGVLVDQVVPVSMTFSGQAAGQYLAYGKLYSAVGQGTDTY